MSFDFNFTQTKLKQIIPQNKMPAAWHNALVEILPKYVITTKTRVSAFIAQTVYESGQFTQLVENLNYSATSLAKTWPNRYAVPGTRPPKPNKLAQSLSRNPSKIANHTYANRMGNGSVESGDGSRFKGRGIIQLTGRKNYTSFANSIGMTLDEVTGYLETPKGATEAACWFWDQNNLNTLADRGDFLIITKRINGGTASNPERAVIHKKVLSIL